MLDKKSKQKSLQRTQQPNKKLWKPAAKNWKKGTDLQPTLKLLEGSPVPEEWKEVIKSTVHEFKTKSSDDLVLHVTDQNNLYVVQHGKGNSNILEDEISTFIVGYCKVPYLDLYRAYANDTHTEAVACEMARNRFPEILSNLHLGDNAQITEDRYY